MQTFQISLFRNKLDNIPRVVERTWQQLCENFQKPRVRLEKDGTLFSRAVFDPPKRAKANARQLSLHVLDLDHAAKLGTIKSALSQLGWAFIISSTHSHLRQADSNPEAEPRYRVVIPLAEPIPSTRFLSLWNHVKNKTGLHVYEAAKDESRIFHTPAIAHIEAVYEYFVEEGPSLDWTTMPLREVVSNDITPGPKRAYEPVTASARSRTDPVTRAYSRSANGWRKLTCRLHRSGLRYWRKTIDLEIYRNGHFMVKVVNYGDVYNDYSLSATEYAS